MNVKNYFLFSRLIQLVFKDKREPGYSVCNSRPLFKTAEFVVLPCLKLNQGFNGLFHPSSTPGTIRSPTLSNGSRVLCIYCYSGCLGPIMAAKRPVVAEGNPPGKPENKK